MKNKKGDDWFPMWSDKWIFGSTRIELNPAERSVWVDLMALGNKDDGYIRANESTPYLHTQLAGLLNIPMELLGSTITKCIQYGKLKEEPPGIYYIISRQNYELSQRHKRRIDKEKNRIEKKESKRASAKADTMSAKTDIPLHTGTEEVVSLWNNRVKDKLPQCSKLTPRRQAHLKLRLSEHPGIKDWETVIDHILATPFLLGDNNRGWKCDFDFLTVNQENWLKIMEGKYTTSTQSTAPAYTLEKCIACEGSGTVAYGEICWKCKGDKQTKVYKK